MSSSLLEIIELVNGEIVLQRADGQGQPLLKMKFSDEAKSFIGDSQIDVVKAMIQAGIEAASMAQLEEAGLSGDELALSEMEGQDYPGQMEDQSAVEELMAEEEANSQEVEVQKTEAANQDDLGDDDSEAPLKESGLGPVRASDLSSSRVLH